MAQNRIRPQGMSACCTTIMTTIIPCSTESSILNLPGPGIRQLPDSTTCTMDCSACFISMALCWETPQRPGFPVPFGEVSLVLPIVIAGRPRFWQVSTSAITSISTPQHRDLRSRNKRSGRLWRRLCSQHSVRRDLAGLIRNGPRLHGCVCCEPWQRFKAKSAVHWNGNLH